MDHPGHKPRTYQLSPIRQVYLKQRFGNINKACWAARGFRKRLEEQKRWPPDWPERLSEKAPNGLKNARIPENGDVYMKTFSDLCSRIRFVRASFGRRSAAAPSGMPGTAADDRDRFRTIRHETTAVFSVGGPSVPPHCGPESRNATFGRAPQGGFCRPAVAGERLRPAYRCKFRICFLFLR